MTDETRLPWLEKEDAATLQNLGRVGGWAPGSYMAKCLDCDFQFTGDKRARQCLPCAIKAHVDEIASLREQLTEAREIIGKLTEKWEKYQHLFDGISDAEAPRHEIEVLDVDLATLRRARAFLTKGETDA